MEEPPNKLSWKHQYKTTVNNYWTKHFRDESENRSTLQFMNFNETQIGKPHLLWQIIGSSVTEVKRSITHCRIATGTYLLQSNISKFSNKQEDPTCPLCGLGDEYTIHLLTSCNMLHQERKIHYSKLKEITIKYIGQSVWNNIFSNIEAITKLIVDASNYYYIFNSKTAVVDVAKVASDLCSALHIKRIILKSEFSK